MGLLTREDMVQQIFENLKELLEVNELLEVSFLENGRLKVRVEDRQSGKTLADCLGNTAKMLASRIG